MAATEVIEDQRGLTPCDVCGNSVSNRLHTATEQMFGFGGRFRYLECGRCGCLTLQDVPTDLGPFYPPEYYSFEEERHRAGRGPRLVRRWFMDRFLGSPRTAGAMLKVKAMAGGEAPRWTLAMAELNLTTASAVLDLGCGSGRRLRHLERMGFTKLTGADPFLPSGDQRAGHVNLLKRTPAELSGTFDFIMCHHSFEHMADPPGLLVSLRERLSPEGAILLRVPLADSFAWRHYGTDWVQLDAPRHLFVFTRDGIGRLAAMGGLRVTRVIYDSDALQFWGSEQYKRGIPLSHPRSYGRDQRSPLFTRSEIKDYERRARDLNAAGAGDQAAFLLEQCHDGPRSGLPLRSPALRRRPGQEPK